MSCATPCTTMCTGCETRLTQPPRDPLNKSHAMRIARAVPVEVQRALAQLRASVPVSAAESMLIVQDYIRGVNNSRTTPTYLHAVLNADASAGYITDSEEDARWVATGQEPGGAFFPPAMGEYFREANVEDGPLQQLVLVLPRLATPEADR